LIEAVTIGIVNVLKNLCGRFIIQTTYQSLVGEDLFSSCIHNRLECHRKLEIQPPLRRRILCSQVVESLFEFSSIYSFGKLRMHRNHSSILIPSSYKYHRRNAAAQIDNPSSINKTTQRPVGKLRSHRVA
jgi:hypothetical protein